MNFFIDTLVFTVWPILFTLVLVLGLVLMVWDFVRRARNDFR